MSVCLSLCLFVSLNFSGISSPIGKCEVLLEPAEQEHSGFEQKQQQNSNFYPSKLWNLIENSKIWPILGLQWYVQYKKSMYLNWGIQWWPQKSHMKGTRIKPWNRKPLKLANLANFWPMVTCCCWVWKTRAWESNYLVVVGLWPF